MKDIYLKFDGGDTKIEGESRDEAHPKWLEALSWTHSIRQPKSATSSTSGVHTAERSRGSSRRRRKPATMFSADPERSRARTTLVMRGLTGPSLPLH